MVGLIEEPTTFFSMNKMNAFVTFSQRFSPENWKIRNVKIKRQNHFHLYK
jgi:hypothetical protein